MIMFLKCIFGFAVFFIAFAEVIYVSLVLFSLEDTKLGISLGISYIVTMVLYIIYLVRLAEEEARDSRNKEVSKNE